MAAYISLSALALLYWPYQHCLLAIHIQVNYAHSKIMKVKNTVKSLFRKMKERDRNDVHHADYSNKKEKPVRTGMTCQCSAAQ